MIIHNFDGLQSELATEFVETGFCTVDMVNVDGFKSLSDLIVELFSKELDEAAPAELSFESLHKIKNLPEINPLRLSVFKGINSYSWVRPTLYSLVRPHIDALVGNEVVMQNRVNLGVMMPSDDTSHIPIHADTDSGESPFQVVVWIPLTKIDNGNGIFFLPEKYAHLTEKFWEIFSNEGEKAATQSISRYLVEPVVNVGQAVIFDSKLLHGSFPNPTNSTRVSLNTRFKALMSPDGNGEKSLGPFYSPTILKPITKRGLATYE